VIHPASKMALTPAQRTRCDPFGEALQIQSRNKVDCTQSARRPISSIKLRANRENLRKRGLVYKSNELAIFGRRGSYKTARIERSCACSFCFICAICFFSTSMARILRELNRENQSVNRNCPASASLVRFPNADNQAYRAGEASARRFDSQALNVTLGFPMLLSAPRFIGGDAN
jgi:hypothetical protein